MASGIMWAAQLGNRTMPPVETKLTEDDRIRVSNGIDNRLRQTACCAGEYAGAVALRRLNRREYHNTIRDLLGADFNVSGLFPNDGTAARDSIPMAIGLSQTVGEATSGLDRCSDSNGSITRP